MKKINWKKEIPFYLGAFLIPLFLMATVHASIGVWPFGEKSILVLDLNGQYVYYFEALKDKLREGGSLFYTWYRAMGGEFMGIFAYYVASPFALIPALFKDGWMTEGLMTMVLLKVGLCGAAMAFYLKKTYKGDPVKAVVISTMYAMSSYAVVQAHNTMWIDALIYLPVLTYALEELIKKGRFRLYVIVLTLTLTANYYIGFMICIYVVIYFLYYYAAHNENSENNFYYEDLHFVKSAVRAGGYSILSAMMSAWVLLPAYYSLTFGKTTFSDPSFIPELKFDPLDLISKFFIGSYDTVEPHGLPFVYCGTLVLLLLPMYFFSSRFSARKKITAGVVLTVFIVSFSTSTLDLVWHGFQRPNWLNYRYSFIFIFLMLIFTHRVLCELESIRFTRVALAAAAVVVLAAVIQKIGYNHFGTYAVVGTFLAAAALLLALHAVKYGYLEKGGVLILCVVIMVEMFSAGLLNTNALDADVVISNRASYNDFLNRLTPIVDRIKESDDGFYRMEKTMHRKTNDNLALGIKGLSNSTSTLHEAQINLLDQLGYSSRSHWSKYLGGTPVSDSLLGIKYIISDAPVGDGLYELYDEDKENSLEAYLNPYALPIAYAVDTGIKDVKFDSFDSPFTRLNTVVAAMLGRAEAVELFKEIPVEDTTMDNLTTSFTTGHIKYSVEKEGGGTSRLTYKITAVNDKPIYMYIPTDYPREVSLSVNSYTKGTYFANETMRVVDLGKYSKGTTLYINLTVKDEDFYITDKSKSFFYWMDEDVFEETMTELNDSPLRVTEYSDTVIKGDISVSEGDGLLFTTIPWDEGWRIEIDGKRAELVKTADSLIACRITEGEHTVELRYLPTNYIVGFTVSTVGIVGFAGAWVLWVRAENKRKQKWLESVDIK